MRESLLILFPKMAIKRLHLVFLRQDYIMVIDHKGFFFCAIDNTKKKNTKKPQRIYTNKNRNTCMWKNIMAILWQIYIEKEDTQSGRI